MGESGYPGKYLPVGAYAESTDENGDQGAETKPVTRSDPGCDHTNGLLMPG